MANRKSNFLLVNTVAALRPASLTNFQHTREKTTRDDQQRTQSLVRDLIREADLRLQRFLQHIEVARLMKSKPLDNMEFMQWMKSYVDGQTGGLAIDGYDGAARRAGSRTGDIRSGAPGRRRPVRPPPAAWGGPLPVTAFRSIFNRLQPSHASGRSWR